MSEPNLDLYYLYEFRLFDYDNLNINFSDGTEDYIYIEFMINDVKDLTDIAQKILNESKKYKSIYVDLFIELDKICLILVKINFYNTKLKTNDLIWEDHPLKQMDLFPNAMRVKSPMKEDSSIISNFSSYEKYEIYRNGDIDVCQYLTTLQYFIYKYDMSES